MIRKTEPRATFAVKDEFKSLPMERKVRLVDSFWQLYRQGLGEDGYFEVCDSTGRQLATGDKDQIVINGSVN
jgi:hypothetical protein